MLSEEEEHVLRILLANGARLQVVAEPYVLASVEIPELLAVREERDIGWLAVDDALIERLLGDDHSLIPSLGGTVVT